MQIASGPIIKGRVKVLDVLVCRMNLILNHCHVILGSYRGPTPFSADPFLLSKIGELSKLTWVIYVGINRVKTIPNITKKMRSIMHMMQSILS